MKFLLFVLGMSFYFIFYLFSKQKDITWGIFSNLFIEAHVYIIISLLCIFLFHTQNFFKKEKDSQDTLSSPIKFYTKHELLAFGKVFFQNSLYLLGLILFYVSVFLIGKEIFRTIDVATLLLFGNTIVIVCIFINPKFRVFQDLLRWNTILLSLYYIVFHLSILSGFERAITGIDILNIVILWVLFFLSFTHNTLGQCMKGFQSYVLAFLFLEICTASFLIFGDRMYCLGTLSFLFSMLFLIGTQNVSKVFGISLSLVRIWGISFSFLFLLFFLFAIITELQYLPWFVLPAFFQVIFLFLFHRYFQNYFTFLWSISGFCMGVYVLFDILSFHQYFSYFSLFFSFMLLFVFLFQNRYYIYDAYFYHSISLWVNIFWVIGLLFSQDFSILAFGIILAIESVYFFASSYIFRKKMRYVTYKNETQGS